MGYRHFSIVFALLLSIHAANSLKFIYGPSVTHQIHVNKEIEARYNKMSQLENNLNEGLQLMYEALYRPDDAISKSCRRFVLGPLNERQDIRQNLYKELGKTIKRIASSIIVVADLQTEIHPDNERGPITLKTYNSATLRKKYGPELNENALYIAEKLFTLPEAKMVESLLRVVVITAGVKLSAETFVARKIKNPTKESGEYDIKVHFPSIPVDPQLDEIIPGSFRGGSYDFIMSQPTGIKRAYLNPDVYIAFYNCLKFKQGGYGIGVASR